MSQPYRDGIVTRQTPVDDMAWRRKVGRGAHWFAACLALEVGLAAASAPTHWTVTFVGTFLAIGLAVGAWMHTAPPPGRVGDLLSWSLRGATAAAGALFVSSRFRSIPQPAVLVTLVLVDALALVWAARSIQRAGSSLRGRSLLLRGLVLFVALVVVLVVLIILNGDPEGGWRFGDLHLVIGGALQLAVAIVVAGLSQLVLVGEQQWWFDNASAAPDTWASLLVLRSGRAEVRRADGQADRFSSGDEAREWLESRGYLPAECAIAEELVSEAPPDPLDAPRSGKRVRG